jgi:phosphoglycolate phosphatase
MARAAGVRPIGVTWGYHDAGALRRAGAEVIFESYAELVPVLARLLPEAAIGA